MKDYNCTFDKHNVTHAIPSLANWLNHSAGYKDSYEY